MLDRIRNLFRNLAIYGFGDVVGAYTAIHGLASDVAVHVAEHNAAVHGMGIDAATDVFNDDAAVCGIRTNVSLARHLQLGTRPTSSGHRPSRGNGGGRGGPVGRRR